MFHNECIIQWFYKKVECPLCRKSFEQNVRDLDQAAEDQEESRAEDHEEHKNEDDLDLQRVEEQRQQLRSLIQAV